MAKFELGVLNAWIMSMPFLALVTCLVGMKKSIVKRMSDMSGYTAKEKCLTISASSLPYPFMIATIWLPLASKPPFLFLGLVIYSIGMAMCAASLMVITKTPIDQPFTAGPYRFSRNPMYVSATTVFIGICLSTGSFILAGYLALMVLLQHFMILAEERICKEKYGKVFDDYLRKVPRYLLKF